MCDGLGPKPQRIAAKFVVACRDGLLRLRPQPIGGAAEIAFLPGGPFPARSEVNGGLAHLLQVVLLPGIGIIEHLARILSPVQERIDLHFIQFSNPACYTHGSRLPSPVMFASAGSGRGEALVPDGSEGLSAQPAADGLERE